MHLFCIVQAIGMRNEYDKADFGGSLIVVTGTRERKIVFLFPENHCASSSCN